MGPDTTVSSAWSARARRIVQHGAAQRAMPWYQDLLSVPFCAGGDDPAVGLDCWGQAAEIARRLGLELPIPGRSAQGLCWLGPSWECATAAGDLLGSDLEGMGSPTHVSTLVDPGRHLVLTCSERSGAFAVPSWTIAHLVGVWRAQP